MLGDSFLKDVFPTLQAMRYGSTVQKKMPPYMYDMFNVIYFFTSPMTFGNNTLLRANNAFIEALNRRGRLPRYILIIFDRDLIDMINRFDFGITEQLDRCIRWFATQMEHSLAARREQIWNVHPGGISVHDTKMIWVEMFDRLVVDQAITIRNKFNKGINELAQQRHNSHVMFIESFKNNKHFEWNGSLNYWGKMQFWREMTFISSSTTGRRHH